MNEQDNKKLEFLFDYTKFHIGMYMTLISAVFALVGLDVLKGCTLEIIKFPLAIGAIGLTLAGAFGSLVASAIPMTKTSSYEKFMKETVGPLCWKWITVRKATYCEHAFF